MAKIVLRGLHFLLEHGPIVTTVAVLNWLKKKYQPKYYEQAVMKVAESVGSDLHVNGPTTVTERTSIGDNVLFNGMFMSGGGSISIGDNFRSGRDCMIISQNHNYDEGDAIPYDETYIYKDVDIGDNVWIGSRVIILPGVSIGEGAIIQAGSTVTTDIQRGAIAGGHPARVFGKRDMAHYEQLSSEGKFHRKG